MISTAITCLHLPCCPTAVGWFVVAMSIFTFDRQSFRVPVRDRPVVERLKVMFPFVAHGNSASAVILETATPFIVASVLHSTPNAKQWVVTKSMLCVSDHVAPTRKRQSFAERIGGDDSDCPAFTFASVLSFSRRAFVGHIFQDGPLAKLLPRVQNDLTHDDTFHVRLRETPGSDNCRGVSHSIKPREVIQCHTP